MVARILPALSALLCLARHGCAALLRAPIARQPSCLTFKSDDVLCSHNNVTVLSPHSTNTRRMRFGQECAVQTEVHCKGPRPASCNGECGDCPCEFDSNGELTSSFMRTVYDQVQPMCASGSQTRMLLIGLGGGAQLQFFLEKCPKTSIDAVEINGDVISIARQFFGLAKAERTYKGRLSLHQADAMKALKLAPRGAYDVIFVDCFSGGGRIPESCRSRHFAEAVRSALKPRGFILQNVWSRAPGDPAVAQEYKDTVAIYKEVFDGGFVDLRVPMPPQADFVRLLQGHAPRQIPVLRGPRQISVLPK